MSALDIRIDGRRLAALIRKEFVQIIRDPSTFLIAFLLPMILLFLFGYAVSLDTTRTSIALVVQDSSAPALGLAQSYRSSPYFDVTTVRSIEPAKEMITSGKVRGIT